MRKRVLVAGATGYLGHAIVMRLHRRGYAVRALVRRDEQRQRFEGVADEVVVARATRGEELARAWDNHGVTAGIDWVVSSLGITRQHDGFGYEDVDFGANLNLLRQAVSDGVDRFAYVSVFRGPELRRSRMVDAKERFVNTLCAARPSHTIIRPTGFFSDMGEFLEMARRGRVYLFGSGDLRLNPIDGTDLADVIIDAMEAEVTEVHVGGPDTFTMEEISHMAFEALGAEPRIVHLPDWIRRSAVSIMGRLSPVGAVGPAEFMLAAMGVDMVAPSRGRRSLEAFFREAVVAHG